jgi:hypothetical protein
MGRPLALELVGVAKERSQSSGRPSTVDADAKCDAADTDAADTGVPAGEWARGVSRCGSAFKSDHRCSRGLGWLTSIADWGWAVDVLCADSLDALLAELELEDTSDAGSSGTAGATQDEDGGGAVAAGLGAS